MHNISGNRFGDLGQQTAASVREPSLSLCSPSTYEEQAPYLESFRAYNLSGNASSAALLFTATHFCLPGIPRRRPIQGNARPARTARYGADPTQRISRRSKIMTNSENSLRHPWRKCKFAINSPAIFGAAVSPVPSPSSRSPGRLPSRSGSLRAGTKPHQSGGARGRQCNHPAERDLHLQGESRSAQSGLRELSTSQRIHHHWLCRHTFAPGSERRSQSHQRARRHHH